MGRHRFHGDPMCFDVLAEYIAERYWRDIHYIADVAGGQGMLARVLTKRYGYQCEVIDPRDWVLRGVKNKAAEFSADMASYYDLLVGLHCDEALREMAQAALLRPTILVPCCNFWSEEKLGQKELLAAIEQFYSEQDVSYERVTFDFKGPKNIGLVTAPALLV